ncbi:MAG: spore coat associated protein CotJA [Firmicutes bacterium]|nr:spore coat associated protein CotJA [Bacillota bacterium]MBQ3123239.1 spore coat associated protein CotJA [Bacillota bacterium]MBQ9972313.1 spore coat associated protein CotJA [Bacillota bacterium]
MPVCLDGCININNGSWGDCENNNGTVTRPGNNNNNNNNGNSIGNLCSCLENLPLAMAYVPMQSWNDVYDMAEGFYAGTIFAELNLPFTGGKRR